MWPPLCAAATPSCSPPPRWLGRARACACCAWRRRRVPAPGPTRRLRPSYAEQPVTHARPAPAAHRASATSRPPSYCPPATGQDGPLPVLMDPYGGPHGQCVVAAHNAYLTSQWFADQGFAVVVADGRGTPGHSPALGEGGLARHRRRHPRRPGRGAAVARRRPPAGPGPGRHPRLVVRRLPRGAGRAAPPGRLPRGRRRRPGHRLAAVRHALHRAVLRHPAGRPRGVRALVRWSPTRGSPARPSRHRPLMLIHGLADDNVVVAHTLRLSSALLAAGRPHEMLPLSGRHAHDAAGADRGEPAAAPSGLPQADVGHVLTSATGKARVRAAGGTCADARGAPPGHDAASPRTASACRRLQRQTSRRLRCRVLRPPSP